MKLLSCSLIFSMTILAALPLQAVSQHREIAPIDIGSSPVVLAHPIDVLRQRIVEKRASIKGIKKAIHIGRKGDVVNIFIVLFEMRESPEVRGLLFDMWRNKQHKHPDLPWDKLNHPVIRTALAATMNRIAAGTIPEFLDYLRSQAGSDNTLVRAQIAMALGMTGYQKDIPLLKRYAEEDNDYVAYSAISGLAFVYNQEAKDVLIGLHRKYKNQQRDKHILVTLREAYNWKPQ